MSYFIGQQPATTFDSGIQDRFTGLTTNTVTLNHDISAEEDILVVWQNIVQDKNSYSVGGTGNRTLTLGGTLVSGDVVTVYYLNKVMQSVNPTAGSVTTTTINDTAVTGAKLNTDVISAQTELSSEPSDTDEFLVSDGGVIKRIDYSLIKGGNNTPYFRVDTTTQTVGSEAVLVFTNSIFDSASGYDTSNGKYTIPSGQGGYWWFQANANIGSSYTGMYFNIKVEGANKLRGVTSNASAGAVHCSGIINVSAGDEVTVALELGTSQGLSSTAYTNAFSGFKLAT
tara:strand:+ start:545 stop:1396 length:852 start_codon:yes stop_codon:yes gene_type:complete